MLSNNSSRCSTIRRPHGGRMVCGVWMGRQECMEAFRSASMKPLSGRQKNKVAPSYEISGSRQDAGPVGQDRCRDYGHKGAGAKRERSAQPGAMP